MADQDGFEVYVLIIYRPVTWRRPWMCRELLVGWANMHMRYSPIPPALDQGGQPLCIPYAIYMNMTIQGNIMALREGVPFPPRLSLQHLIDLFLGLPPHLQNMDEMLTRLHNLGIQSEDDYNNQNQQGRRYSVIYVDGYGPRIPNATPPHRANELSQRRLDRRIRRQIREWPIIAEILPGPELAANRFIHHPFVVPQLHDGIIVSHAINLTGEGISYEDHQTPVLEFLNSHGIQYGNRGFGEVMTMHVYYVYRSIIRPWWNEDDL